MMSGLGSVDPTKRRNEAVDKLREAENAFARAESDLIKARREFKDASEQYRKFFNPRQEDFY